MLANDTLCVHICRFADACAAYCQGGCRAQGLSILQQLADNAVAERRFDDAAHGYYKLAMEAMQVGDFQSNNTAPRCTDFAVLSVMIKAGCCRNTTLVAALAQRCTEHFEHHAFTW
jgi:hypothetical protein